MKKAVKAKVVRKEIEICIYSRKIPQSIKNERSFDVIQVKKFEIFMERLINRDPLLSSIAHFPKMGRSPTI